MTVEREIKVKLDQLDLAKLREWLNDRCVPLGEEVQVDTYFRHPCRDFEVTDEALRLRKRGGADQAELCYKGPRSVGGELVKAREEIEVSVKSASELSRILVRLGFEPVAEVVKEREIFDCGNFITYLDHIEELGDFAEFEARGVEQAELVKLLKNFGLLEKAESRTYLEL
ncbi:MAG: class IV adenylate cyclase, partial [Fervidicoccaceae archaeon]